MFIGTNSENLDLDLDYKLSSPVEPQIKPFLENVLTEVTLEGLIIFFKKKRATDLIAFFNNL